MTFRPSLLQQRRLCGLMLLAWLFAVLSGTVNACVLADKAQAEHHERHEHHAHDVTHDTAPDASLDEAADEGEQAHHLAHEHMRAADAPPHQADAHVACHKFCKDEGQALPQNPHRDSADFAPMLILYGSPLLPEAKALAPVALTAERPPAHGPPLVIRLLRLTL